MNISVFDVLGPVMIGPSSSHTAGAARLARASAVVAGVGFIKVSFGLSGSFAKTGKGHGTHKALLAGALGFAADDEKIRDIDAIAAEKNIRAEYFEEDLYDMHENSVHIIFEYKDGKKTEIWGSSIGGGRILIKRIDDIKMSISTDRPTIIIPHLDRSGVVSDVSGVFALSSINIAVMSVSRESKGKNAIIIIETDEKINNEIVEMLKKIKHVTGVMVVDLPQL